MYPAGGPSWPSDGQPPLQHERGPTTQDWAAAAPVRGAEAGWTSEEAGALQELDGHTDHQLKQAVPSFAPYGVANDAGRDARAAASLVAAGATAYGGGLAPGPSSSTLPAQSYAPYPQTQGYPQPQGYPLPSPSSHPTQHDPRPDPFSYFPQAPTPSFSDHAPLSAHTPVPAGTPTAEYPFWLDAQGVPAQGGPDAPSQPHAQGAQFVAGLAQFRSASGDAGAPYEQGVGAGQAYDASIGMAARSRQPSAPSLPHFDAQPATFGTAPMQQHAAQPSYAPALSHGGAVASAPAQTNSQDASTQTMLKQYWAQQQQHHLQQHPFAPSQPSPLTAQNPYSAYPSTAQFGAQASPDWSTQWPTPDSTPQNAYVPLASTSQHSSYDSAGYPFTQQYAGSAALATGSSSTAPPQMSPVSIGQAGGTSQRQPSNPYFTLPGDFSAPTSTLQDTSSAAKRSRLVTSPDDDAPPAPRRQSSKTSANPNKKLTTNLSTACIVCGEPIARLILRGKRAELDVPHSPVFTCLRCSSSSASPDHGPGAGPSKADKPKKPSFRKRNKRFDDASATAACDVCLRDIAVGGVLPLPLDNPPADARITFMIEIVCVSCDVKYKRCSDCGGGGGSRAGTGKWRCAQLFPPGRKTCCLNHQRLGAFPAMEYTVWRNSDIPAAEVGEISSLCEAMFRNSMLAGLCIPEVMEQDGAVWSTYEKCYQRAKQGWMGFDSLLRNDVEQERQIRRYLALRTCTPNLRKTSRPTRHTPGESPADSPEPHSPEVDRKPGIVLKEGKEIAGFIIAEHELLIGNLFLCLVLPWDPTGEIFDATSLLISSLVRHVDTDIKATNAQRAQEGLPQYPDLVKVWTMLFFKRESRVLTSLVKKRGFMHLDDYLAAHPDVPPEQFPPHRQCYLPVERQEGWEILVRQQRQMADGSVDDWGARRAADEERGKKKELRAKAQAQASASSASTSASTSR
ncbi:hypothetical protein JCM10450v2_000575 [Rhodotorula kratochvilovae]